MAVGGDETSRSGRAIWRQALPLFVACVGASTRLGASALRAVPRSAARSRRGSALDCERVPDGLDRSQLWAPLTAPDLWPPSDASGCRRSRRAGTSAHAREARALRDGGTTAPSSLARWTLPARRHILLEAQLSERLGRPVQCVVMNTAPADLVHQVLMDRVLLLDLEPSRRIRFEIDARNRHFDVKPLLDRYRRVESVA